MSFTKDFSSPVQEKGFGIGLNRVKFRFQKSVANRVLRLYYYWPHKSKKNNENG